VVIESNTLDKLVRKRRKQGNIQNRTVGHILLLKNESVKVVGNVCQSAKRKKEE
jgi:hypothetical protein